MLCMLLSGSIVAPGNKGFIVTENAGYSIAPPMILYIALPYAPSQ